MTMRAYDARHAEYLPERYLTLFESYVDYTEEPPLTVTRDALVDIRHAALVRAQIRGPIDPAQFDQLLDTIDADLYWTTIIGVYDEDRAAMFEDMLTQVADEPSGDDDCFDYWPSGVRLAAQLAPNADALERLINEVSAVIANKPILEELDIVAELEQLAENSDG